MHWEAFDCFFGIDGQLYMESQVLTHITAIKKLVYSSSVLGTLQGIYYVQSTLVN
jgi:hypothetical protein